MQIRLVLTEMNCTRADVKRSKATWFSNAEMLIFYLYLLDYTVLNMEGWVTPVRFSYKTKSVSCRLEDAEKALQQEAAAEGESNVGLATSSATRLNARTPFNEASLFGGDSGNPSDPSRGVPRNASHRSSSPMNVDDDVRELENMFLGVDGNEWDAKESKSLQVSSNASAADEIIGKSPQTKISTVVGGGGLTSSPGGKSKREGLGAAGNVSGNARQAFSIEEEGEEAVEVTGTDGSNQPVSPPLPVSGNGNVNVDLDVTEILLGSIAESLTPGASLEGTSAGNDSTEPPASMAMTKSELALVNLMVEAGEESGDMLVTRGQQGPKKTMFGNEESEPTPMRGISRGNSGFDDVLIDLSLGSSHPEAVHGSGGRVGPTSAPPTRVGDGHVRKAVAPLRSPRSTLRNELVSATMVPAPTAANRDHEEAKEAFSLGHRRWVSCGFKSGLVVDMSGPASAVSAALMAAGSVLALDSLNYFLWRCDDFAVALHF